MFNIYQSNQTEQLLTQLLHAYQSDDIGMFEPFVVLVPSMVLGEWLQNRIADEAGISTLITTEFWGRYQWQMMKQVIDAFNDEQNDKPIGVPDVAMLSTSVMQWRLFAYLLTCYQQYVADNPAGLQTDNQPINQSSSQTDTQANINGLYSVNNTDNAKQAQSLNPMFAKVYSLSHNPNNSQTSVSHNVSHNVSNSGLKNDPQNVPSNMSSNMLSKEEEQQLWRLAQSLAGAFNRYLTHRDDWLQHWTAGQAVDVKQLIAQKDWLNQQFDEHASNTPEWIQDSYIELELAQRHLWQALFAELYRQRQAIERRFWEGLDFFAEQPFTRQQQPMLPKRLYLFTIQQMPLNELDFIKKLSTYIDIELLFYNPSQAYWADIVDKRWLVQQQITNPSMAYVRDFGHTLLSRLGKQSRDTFASLVDLSGNVAKEQRHLSHLSKHSSNQGLSSQGLVSWQDDFVLYQDDKSLSLLQRLQQDVLIMDDALTRQYIEQRLLEQSQTELTDQITGITATPSRQWQQGIIDNSLSIHSCHNLQRQLEVMRGMIARWLNEDIDNDNPKADKPNQRRLSDILVLLPDVDSHHDLIQAMFAAGEGIDGLSLPAKVTGVVDRQIRSLWQAIMGYYQLVGQAHASFGWSQVFDWLMLPEVYQSYGLGYDEMQRGCELLRQAGFIRGFDETHLRQHLHSKDDDFRFCFAYALDRLVAGILMPKATLTDVIYYPVNTASSHISHLNHAPLTLPLSSLTLNDAPIVSALCQIYGTLAQRRHDYQRKRPAIKWLDAIETDIIHRHFALYDDSKSMRAIFTAINGLKKSLTADKTATSETLSFRLEFLLQSIQSQLEAQQISAEPTGVITFARFGALRTVPYKLVVMLNMDISQFPRQERDDHLDLMKAGLARRGDKRSDDEDNGAFLDALLCAKEACWIFYNGQQMGDATEHLPAQPVSELMQFLQAEVDWQFEQMPDQSVWQDVDTQHTGIQSEIKKAMQEQILSRLVTKHPALPYDASVFEVTETISKTQNAQNKTDCTDHADNINNINHEQAQLVHLFADTLQAYQRRQQASLPPAPIWQQIYHALQSQRSDKLAQHPIRLPNDEDYQQLLAGLSALSTFDNDIIQPASQAWQTTAVELLRRFCHPAKHHLKHQQIALRYDKDKADTLEPMVLDNLASYQLTDHLLEHFTQRQFANAEEYKSSSHHLSNATATTTAMLLNDTLLPAGVNRDCVLTEQIKQLQQQFDTLMTDLSQSKYAHLLKTNTLSDIPADTAVITPVSEQQVVLSVPQSSQQTSPFQSVLEVTVQAKLPSHPKDALWINMLPKKDHAKHKLGMWLHHLLWQIARHNATSPNTFPNTLATLDTSDPLAGTSIWQFNGASAYVLPPMSQADATAELQKWLLLAQWLDNHVMVMMPSHAFTYLDKLSDATDEGYTPTPTDFSAWLKVRYGQDWVSDECSKHPIWQYVLAGHDEGEKMNIMTNALQNLAQSVYGELHHTITPLIDDASAANSS